MKKVLLDGGDNSSFEYPFNMPDEISLYAKGGNSFSFIHFVTKKIEVHS